MMMIGRGRYIDIKLYIDTKRRKKILEFMKGFVKPFISQKYI